MTVGIPSIKKEAKALLKGNWVSVIISSLTVLFSFFIIYNIGWVLSLVIGDIASYVVLAVLGVLLLGPLSLGVIRYFYRIKGGMDETPATVFYYFSFRRGFNKAIRLCLALAVRFLLTAAIFYLPAVLVYVISSPNLYDFLKMPIPLWSQHLTYLVNFLSSLASVLTAFSLLKFYLAPFLIIADDEMDVEEAVLMSTVISKTTITDFVFLGLSLILWIILSLLYIPLLFTLPYFIMCYVVHSLYAINAYNERINKINNQNLPMFEAGI